MAKSTLQQLIEELQLFLPDERGQLAAIRQMEATSHSALRPFQIIDAEAEFGVVLSGGVSGADQAPAIQAALNAAYALSPNGCIVQLPPGSGYIGSPLTVRGATWLRGHGPTATVLQLYNDSWGAQGAVIHLDTTQSAAKVSDLAIAVNVRATGSLDNTMHGIKVEAGTVPFGLGGVVTEVERVLITNVTGDGINWGTLEGRIRDCYVRTYAGSAGVPGSGAGYRITGTDNMITNCTADTCASVGFTVASSNNKFIGCKAFGCGQFSVSGNAGFLMSGTRNMYVGCEAQDNYGAGFSDPGGGNMFAGCVSDSNGASGIAAGQIGFYVIGNSSVVGCFAIDRIGGRTKYAFHLEHNPGTPSEVPIVRGCCSFNMITGDIDPASNAGTAEINGTTYIVGTTPIKYSGLPTVDPHVVGQLWSNAGVLTISAG